MAKRTIILTRQENYTLKIKVDEDTNLDISLDDIVREKWNEFSYIDYEASYEEVD